MKKYLPLIIPMLALAACSSDDPEPAKPEPARLLAVDSSDGCKQTFVYDRSGRIREWILSVDYETINSSYSYPDNNSIEIETRQTIKVTGEDRHFSETVNLANGLISVIDGQTEFYQNGEQLLAAQYSLEFTYDSFHQLHSIDWTQWRNSENRPWRWTNTVTWKGGNIMEYADANGASEPREVTTYEYYANSTADSNPIALPHIMAQYLPLQRAGMMGKQPKQLVKTATTENRLTNSKQTDDYAYTFTVAADRSYLQSYTITFDGYRPVTYSLTWD